MHQCKPGTEILCIISYLLNKLNEIQYFSDCEKVDYGISSLKFIIDCSGIGHTS